MTESAGNYCEKEEATILDILVTVADSWRLILLGPLIAGIFAGGFSFLLPKTFESVAIVRLAEDELALLHTATVLDPLIERFGLLGLTDGVWEEARLDLKKRIQYAIDKKTKLATISAKADTPDKAKALGDASIELLLKELRVKGQEKLLIEKTVAINERAIDIATDAIESIQLNLKKGVLADQAQESAVKNLASINSDIAKRAQENATLLQKLEIRGEEIFVQKPNLPMLKTSPKNLTIMLMVQLGATFLMLMYVFIRKAWNSANERPIFHSKVSIIKKSLFGSLNKNNK